mmetsp:Transcript_18651/g.49086  ORF Transcript_18651/g.49086 Transcript_18651/m.49086 type:complete len:233 (-) Transcript_18651:456-1154(-)
MAACARALAAPKRNRALATVAAPGSGDRFKRCPMPRPPAMSRGAPPISDANAPPPPPRALIRSAPLCAPPSRARAAASVGGSMAPLEYRPEKGRRGDGEGTCGGGDGSIGSAGSAGCSSSLGASAVASSASTGSGGSGGSGGGGGSRLGGIKGCICNFSRAPLRMLATDCCHLARHSDARASKLAVGRLRFSFSHSLTDSKSTQIVACLRACFVMIAYTGPGTHVRSFVSHE